MTASLAPHRFADHLPYYRLEEILQRSGLTIDRARQSRWMQRLGIAVSPLVSLMRRLGRKKDMHCLWDRPIDAAKPRLLNVQLLSSFWRFSGETVRQIDEQAGDRWGIGGRRTTPTIGLQMGC